MSKPTRTTVPALIEELMYGPATFAELLEASGMPDSTLRMWMAQLREKDRNGFPRVVRIREWQRSQNENRVWEAIYELNLEHKKDAPRPKKMTQAQRQAGYKERRRLRRLNKANGVATQKQVESTFASIAKELLS